MKIDLNELERAIERKPGLTLPELVKLFNCTKQSIGAVLKKAKKSDKKRHFHTPKEASPV